jgi:hypothetical protein
MAPPRTVVLALALAATAPAQSTARIRDWIRDLANPDRAANATEALVECGARALDALHDEVLAGGARRARVLDVLARLGATAGPVVRDLVNGADTTRTTRTRRPRVRHPALIPCGPCWPAADPTWVAPPPRCACGPTASTRCIANGAGGDLPARVGLTTRSPSCKRRT